MYKIIIFTISILLNIFLLFIIGVYFLINSWFFNTDLRSVAGVKPDYLIQLSKEGKLYDKRQDPFYRSISNEVKAYKLYDSNEIEQAFQNSPRRYQVLICEIDREAKQYIIYDGSLDHYIVVNIDMKKYVDDELYDNFVGRIKEINNYNDRRLNRYRDLIENGEWKQL